MVGGISMSKSNISLNIISIVLILVLFFAFLTWYNFYDIIGLKLYENEPIAKMFSFHNTDYILTDEGYVYVMGEYNSSSRKYRNSKSYKNHKLGTPAPVRICDEKITKIIPYDKLGALLINEDGAVFDFNDFTLVKIFDGASYAIRGNYEYGEKIFGEGNERIYYVINANDTLYASNGQGQLKELFSDVIAVDYYLDTILVLFKNGDLNQYLISDNGGIVHKETIFEDVSYFDIEDTSIRYDGEKFVFDDKNAQNTPLINVLTKEGDLYAIGAYNLLCCTRSIAAYPDPKIISEWTQIAENVENFSLAPMGTGIKFKNGTAGYYGFDTNNASDSEFQFGYIDLDLTDVVDVYASDVQVFVKTEQTFYIWGYSTIYNRDGRNHNLFDGTPIVISP